MIDLTALRSLEAVDQFGSVVAAADGLGFTPSAVSQQIKRLERQADVAVVHRWGDVPIAIPDHVERRTVHRDEAEVILRTDHRLAKRRSVSPADLVDEHWIATPEGTICRQWLSRMYAGTGRLPQI